ncbi:MAG: ATP-binding protein [Cyclobacteriaceae bacterium]|nr:ATP-binding protein [Cyclobacteriaceae bacterium]
MSKNGNIDNFINLGKIQVKKAKYILNVQKKVFSLLQDLSYSKFRATHITSLFLSVCKHFFAKENMLSIQIGFNKRECYYLEFIFFLRDEIQELSLLDNIEKVFCLKEYSVNGHQGNGITLGVKYENENLLKDDLLILSLREKIETKTHDELLDQLKETNKKMEISLQKEEEVNSELEAFSYSVSHDLRAPLRHMIGFAELLKKHVVSDDEKISRFIDNILLSSKRMGSLIDDLLHFSRTGRATISPRQIDVNELIPKIIKELTPPNSSRKIDWVINKLPVITADYALIGLVFQNLISNAIKYSGKKETSEIEIGSYTENNEHHVFFVKDNGAGFNMEYSDKLFGVFSRLHRSDEFEGTGIGLANVKRIVHKHNGDVWAKGKENQGATFYFKLPIN